MIGSLASRKQRQPGQGRRLVGVETSDLNPQRFGQLILSGRGTFNSLPSPIQCDLQMTSMYQHLISSATPSNRAGVRNIVFAQACIWFGTDRYQVVDTCMGVPVGAIQIHTNLGSWLNFLRLFHLDGEATEKGIYLQRHYIDCL
ncbi:hypothetical protein CCM_04080 [Cordyceps militaris CM01]|uniref:Uncharacterized protein n=1 Tax=Cordyceps militaris (strain CM01) TaxID=983644 RepID=G3JDN2_CORMM|nr:uncharacterized protein CCM_04080 [Cordyceps militaris CM01]EGX92707.1 hypothetical protein CCM_04080 [Cordyceps militaris CM01]